MTAAAQRFQSIIHEAAQVFCERNKGVRSGAEVIQRQRLLGAIRAKHGVARRSYLTYLCAGRQILQIGHDRIDPSVLQVAHGISMADRHSDQPRVWHLGAEEPQQPRQYEDLQVIRQTDSKDRLGEPAIEPGLRAQRRLDLFKRWTQAVHHRDSARGRLHRAPLADEQCIAGHRAQTSQRVADRGLSDMKTLGRPADMALSHECRKYGQEVEVYPAQVGGVRQGTSMIDGSNSDYWINRFPSDLFGS